MNKSDSNTMALMKEWSELECQDDEDTFKDEDMELSRLVILATKSKKGSSSSLPVTTLQPV